MGKGTCVQRAVHLTGDFCWLSFLVCLVWECSVWIGLKPSLSVSLTLEESAPSFWFRK